MTGGPRLSRALAAIAQLPGFDLPRVEAALSRAARPERAAEVLEEAARVAPGVLAAPEELIEIAGASSRAARLLAQDPLLLAATEDLEGIVASCAGDTARFDAALRRYRNRRTMQIALRELRDADVRETAAELADLASSALSACVAHHLPILVARHGAPEPACAFAIVGMGKLGGRELNFSSDVDLVYLYEHDAGAAGALTLHHFYVKLFERVTASMSRPTRDGIVFRVDLDLRPEGRRGPLANSLASAERYYEAWGRTWERAAWIRARPVAGDERFGAAVLEMIRPFVWRRAYDLDAIREIVAMKDRIDASRRPGLDVKLGVGGIREIEFYAQAHQLLHGGRDARLRTTNTLEALARLSAAGLISARTRERLGDAYLFLRKVEHRLQIADEAQTHALPADPEERAAIARSLGFDGAPALETALAAAMGEVNGIFRALMGTTAADAPIAEVVLVAVDTEADVQARLQALASLGVRDPEAALSAIDAASRHPRSPLHPRAELRRREAATRFVAECAQSPDADRALRRLPELLRTLAVHGALLDVFDSATMRRGIARLLGASELLAQILVSSPGLVAHVLAAPQLPPIGAIAVDPGSDAEAALRALRAVKQEETLRTAVAHMAGLIDTEAASERLSALASSLLEAALGLALAAVVERYGAPPPGAGIALVAAGTLGAREMGYVSDVDLSIVFDGEGETDRKVGCAELFTRVAQKLVGYLSMGGLYAVDVRLRPSGSQGPLVVSLARFTAYHAQAAQLWERQALVRARTVAGAPELRARIDRAIAEAAYGPGPVEGAGARIDEMRRRLGKGRGLDLKLGEGGLVEAEFLVQHLLIQHGRDRPEVRATSTREALAAVGKAGIVPLPRALALRDAYGVLRTAHTWLRVLQGDAVDRVPQGAMRSLALAAGREGADAARHLSRELGAAMALIHGAYRDLLGAV